jgi:pimeloyl-ACP methyl ester carboxylesterase
MEVRMLRFCLLLAVALLSTEAAAKTRLVGDLPRRDGKPLAVLPGLEIEYGVVRTSEGVRLRSILTRPAGTRQRLPAMMVIQWVSCGSLDFTADRQSHIRDLAEQSGMVLVRIERAGTGDSEGPDCAALDYDTELRHYREAFDQVARHAWIDGARIVLYGSSLGATTAPLVSLGKRVAGVAVQGGGAVTYLERMINFDRLFLERSGKYSPAQIHEEMSRRIPFHVEYLLKGRTPEQIERERPELRGVWQAIRGGAEAPPHYGRAYAWHQQAASKDFLEAWTRVDAPVLVIYGEYDQFEPRHGHKLIADTVNRLRPGTATFIEVAEADHDIELYATAEDAYAYRNPTIRRELLVQPLIQFARRVSGMAP